MLKCTIVVEEHASGIITADQVPHPENQNATELETAIASVLDIALKTAMQYIMVKARNGGIIEGKDIEAEVMATMAKARRGIL